MDAQTFYGVTLRGQASTAVDSVGPSAQTVGGPISNPTHFNLGTSNPLFWLLVLLLIVIGYLGFLFDFSLKRVVSGNLAVGNKAK